MPPPIPEIYSHPPKQKSTLAMTLTVAIITPPDTFPFLPLGHLHPLPVTTYV